MSLPVRILRSIAREPPSSIGMPFWTLPMMALQPYSHCRTLRYAAELADEIAELIHAQQRMDDPIAEELAQDQIGILQCDWNESHGADLVAATRDYVAANHRHMKVDAWGVDYWVTALEDTAGKVKRRLAAASHMTLPVGDSPPYAATVSHGFSSDHVGQSGRNSHHVQTL